MDVRLAFRNDTEHLLKHVTNNILNHHFKLLNPFFTILNLRFTIPSPHFIVLTLRFTIPNPATPYSIFTLQYLILTSQHSIVTSQYSISTSQQSISIHNTKTFHHISQYPVRNPKQSTSEYSSLASQYSVCASQYSLLHEIIHVLSLFRAYKSMSNKGRNFPPYSTTYLLTSFVLDELLFEFQFQTFLHFPFGFLILRHVGVRTHVFDFVRARLGQDGILFVIHGRFLDDITDAVLTAVRQTLRESTRKALLFPKSRNNKIIV